MTAGQAFVVPLHETSHMQEDAQFTVPQAGSSPVQVAVQGPVPQLIVPQAALPPEQISVQAPAPQLTEPHALLPAQVAEQSPVVHEILPHAALPPPPEQLTAQSPDVQLTLPHAFAPTQLTVQSFVLQVIPRHALPAVHSISHDAAFEQLIMPHAPLVLHAMSQFQPVGQVMFPLPVPTMLHVDVAKSHMPLHTVGQTAASTGRLGASSRGFWPITQKPCVQMRSDVQSACDEHL
jgi:hypothetical protein